MSTPLCSLQEDYNEGVRLSSPVNEACEVLSRSSTVTKVIQLSTMWFVTKDQKQLRVQTGPSTGDGNLLTHSENLFLDLDPGS